MTISDSTDVKFVKFIAVTFGVLLIVGIVGGYSFVINGELFFTENDFKESTVKVLCYIYFGFFIVANSIMILLRWESSGRRYTFKNWFLGSLAAGLFAILSIIFIKFGIIYFWLINIVLIPPLVISGFISVIGWSDVIENMGFQGGYMLLLQLLIYLVFFAVLIGRIYHQFS